MRLGSAGSRVWQLRTTQTRASPGTTDVPNGPGASQTVRLLRTIPDWWRPAEHLLLPDAFRKRKIILPPKTKEY